MDTKTHEPDGCALGARIIVFSAACPAGATTAVDVSSRREGIDWRRRSLHVVLRFSTMDIRPGQACDNEIANVTQAQSMLDTSDGDDGALGGHHWTFAPDLHLFALKANGDLVVRNHTDRAQYVVGMLFVAEPFGAN